MREKVRAAIVEHALIAPGETVLVGLSGGPDSVALLHVLIGLAPPLRFSLAAAHLNHGIRGEAAAEDERFVRELCELLGVPLYVERADVPALAEERGWTMEQAGREARYAFLERARQRAGASRIAVAHHMDDQAESILLHLTRGTGLTGLVGMLPRRGPLIRPLLFVRRSDVERYLSEEGLAYCVDATNLETGSTRNRLRLDVVPYIEEHINPAFVKTLCSMGELLLRDESYLAAQAEAALEAARRENGFDRESLRALPLPLLARALRAALREAGASVNIERVHIEQLVRFLGARTGATLELPGVQAHTDYACIRFTRAARAADTPPCFEIPFVPEGETLTPLGRFISRPCPYPQEGFGENRLVAYMDAAALEGAVARPRREGDRIRPIGAPGHRKLKQYFIDRKVPREKRRLPLLCRGDEALFVPGFCSGEKSRVSPETARILRVEYVPAPQD